MNRKKRLTLYLISILMLMAGLVGYRVYLFVYEGDYQALNAENIERIETSFHGETGFHGIAWKCGLRRY
jgi:1,2-diacylglycerol 3-alpha-glucosyltransferase